MYYLLYIYQCTISVSLTLFCMCYVQKFLPSPLAVCGVNKLWMPYSSSVPLREPSCTFLIQQFVHDMNSHQFTGFFILRVEQIQKADAAVLFAASAAFCIFFYAVIQCVNIFLIFPFNWLYLRDVCFCSPGVFGNNSSLCTLPVLGV